MEQFSFSFPLVFMLSLLDSCVSVNIFCMCCSYFKVSGPWTFTCQFLLVYTTTYFQKRVWLFISIDTCALKECLCLATSVCATVFISKKPNCVKRGNALSSTFSAVKHCRAEKFLVPRFHNFHCSNLQGIPKCIGGMFYHQIMFQCIVQHRTTVVTTVQQIKKKEI